MCFYAWLSVYLNLIVYHFHVSLCEVCVLASTAGRSIFLWSAGDMCPLKAETTPDKPVFIFEWDPDLFDKGVRGEKCICVQKRREVICVCVWASEGEEDGWKAVDRVCLNRELLWRITVPLIRAREEIERRKWERERGQADVNMSLRSTGFVWPVFGLNPLLWNATIQGELQFWRIL